MEAVPIPVPDKPCSLDEVIERWPEVRQSWLSTFDDCALSSWFDLRYGAGHWNTTPAAIGVIFHRVAAACLKEMRAMDSETVPVAVALAILEEELMQRDVPPEEYVRIPRREIRELRWIVAKFARDNSFTVRSLIDIEERISAVLGYTDADGTVRTRILTGKLDTLVGGDAPDEAIIVDFKSGWGLPAKPRNPDPTGPPEPEVSYEGLFQLHFYGWLVLKNYPSVNTVRLREFYVRRTEARTATLHRDDMERTERDLADLVRDLDRCLASGKPKRLRLPDVAPWNPSPGKHCGFCVAAHRCPIEADARLPYAVNTEKAARRAAGELQVVEKVRKALREGLRAYCERHGSVPVKARGHVVVGLRTQKGGKPVLTTFTPDGDDVPPRRDLTTDEDLEDTLTRSLAEQREAHGD